MGEGGGGGGEKDRRLLRHLSGNKPGLRTAGQPGPLSVSDRGHSRHLPKIPTVLHRDKAAWGGRIGRRPGDRGREGAA